MTSALNKKDLAVFQDFCGRSNLSQEDGVTLVNKVAQSSSIAVHVSAGKALRTNDEMANNMSRPHYPATIVHPQQKVRLLIICPLCPNTW